MANTGAAAAAGLWYMQLSSKFSLQHCLLPYQKQSPKRNVFGGFAPEAATTLKPSIVISANMAFLHTRYVFTCSTVGIQFGTKLPHKSGCVHVAIGKSCHVRLSYL